MKYAVVTFGCRVNQADSLGFEEALLADGAEAAPLDRADLVIVNTCSVTATADQGARQTIRRVARDNPTARIVVTGCYATRRPDEIRALPNVAHVIANDDKPQLVEWVRLKADTTPARRVRLQPDLFDVPLAFDRAVHGKADTTADRNGDGPCGATIEPGVAGRTAFTLRVQTGCGESCSYCIIPTTRGAPRSVPMDALVREVDRVAAAGFKEIALTGVHLGSYGRDLTPRSALVELLRELDAHAHRAALVRLKADTTDDGRGVRLQPDVLFRISSLEPMDCTHEIVDLVARSRLFARHFHLPLQHASDRLLAAMRRPYTIAEYASLVDDIRARIPSASIGSDIIVGFPGETDEDVDALSSYLERSPLTHVHVFPYSDRPGTAAASLKGKVHGAAIRERARRIRDIGARLASRFRDSQVGTTHRGLTIEDGSLVVTDNYLKLRIPPGRARNERLRVRVVDRENATVLDRQLTDSPCTDSRP